MDLRRGINLAVDNVLTVGCARFVCVSGARAGQRKTEGSGQDCLAASQTAAVGVAKLAGTGCRAHHLLPGPGSRRRRLVGSSEAVGDAGSAQGAMGGPAQLFLA